MKLLERIQHGWSAFINSDNPYSIGYNAVNYGPSVAYSMSPNRSRLMMSGERSILASIYNRIAIDCANVEIHHVKTDELGRYTDKVKSGLQYCLNVEANIDQPGTAFRQDIFHTILEEGVAAIVPVETTANPDVTGTYTIKSMRVGTITEWYPKHVKVLLYNEARGRKEEIVLPKNIVAIVENPLYSVMNEPNSTYQRLVRKLNMLDVIDEQTSSGKLDIIIQLPYVVKNERKLKEAEQRSQSIETQLKNSKYGVAYIDGTERITQLNRPAENNLLKQVEQLTDMLHDQLGITPEVLRGTATEDVMTNYMQRTIGPIMTAVVESLTRTFLTRTAITQGQDIRFVQNPFSLIPVSKMAEMADKLTRNEILSSNEIRGALAYPPSDDPRADMLLNKNLPSGEEGAPPLEEGEFPDEDHGIEQTPPSPEETTSLGKLWAEGLQ